MDFELTYADGSKRTVKVDQAKLITWLESCVRIQEQLDFDNSREVRKPTAVKVL